MISRIDLSELLLSRPLTIAAAITAVVTLSACATSPRDNNPAAPGTGNSAALVPAVPTAQVLDAVARAASVTKLPKDLTPSLSAVRKDTGFAVVGPAGCEPDFAATMVKISNCTFGDPRSDKTLIMVGDSHSSMWLPAFDQIGTRLKWKIINLNKVNCGASSIEPYLYQEKRPYKECVAWMRWVISTINDLKPQVVVFTSQISKFAKLGDGTRLTPAIWRSGLDKTLAAITPPDTKKVVLGDIPYVWQDAYGAGPTCLSTHQDDLKTCSSPRGEAVRGEYQRVEKAAAKSNGARYIDITPWFCASRCYSVVNKTQVYSDWQHITATYAKYLSGSVEEALAPDLATGAAG